MRKYVYTFAVFFCILTNSTAQQLQHQLGNILVQPQLLTDMQLLEAELQTFDGKLTQLHCKHILKQPFHTWLLQFDYATIDEQALLNFLNNHPAIINAQFNHFCSLRATPNDPLFDQQWQYVNAGLLGGVANADLDADQAWDISTGGLTPNGDTIVVCIIDSGIDADHEDLSSNLWINHAEIPDNNIDDDNNGYVDDYHGWNSIQDNDNISPSNSHGTSVAGIVGAQGNNNIGVTGINWEVEMMIIRGGTGLESEVLKAYGYAYDARKRYNDTNGAAGAFVVATNSSWGTDEGNPADAPLWCSFYDSLGMVGIINCGATANENFDVDQVGDLPTTCSSDFLIAVTNINRADEKELNAGYGLTHIDLGAYGEDAYTTSWNDNYNNFGGTSGATPHVAGTVALMYAAPCANLADLALDDPAAAALLAKDYILQGTEYNASLDGITVTNGRLNTFNSLQLVMENCTSCPLPSSITAIDISDTNVRISWIASADINSINLRWRLAGTGSWNTANNLSPNDPYLLTNLVGCTDYEFQISANCPNENSGFSATKTFKTDGCCEAPNEIVVSSLDDTSVVLNWSAVLAASGGYNVRFREIGTNTWGSLIPVNQNNIAINNLMTCTEYEVQVQSICSSGPTGFSPSLVFQTTNCGTCTDADYCSSAGGNSSSEWIAGVALNDINNMSASDDGYGDYTAMSTDLEQGETYTLVLTPGFDDDSYGEYFLVRIDYNQNGAFEDDEIVYDPEALTEEILFGEITIPTTALAGSTRMRVSMKWTAGTLTGAGACENNPNFEFGEVEDYCVNIIEPIATTATPIVENLKLTPNPFVHSFQATFQLVEAGNIRASLLNTQGQIISTQQVHYATGIQQFTFDNLNALAAGIYLLQIESNGSSICTKVIKGTGK